MKSRNREPQASQRRTSNEATLDIETSIRTPSPDREIKIPLCIAPHSPKDGPYKLQVDYRMNLPSEMLLEIFRTAVSVDRVMLTSLSSTCRRWRYIVLDTPSLWTEIHCTIHTRNDAKPDLQLTRSLKRLRAHIARSRTLPLAISIDGEVDAAVDELREVKRVLGSGLLRCSRLDIRAHNAILIQYVLIHPLPTLRDISLQGEWTNSYCYPILCPPTGTLSLINLSISGKMKPRHWSLPNLRHLSVDWEYALRYFPSTPSLESLWFSANAPHSRNDLVKFIAERSRLSSLGGSVPFVVQFIESILDTRISHNSERVIIDQIRLIYAMVNTNEVGNVEEEGVEQLIAALQLLLDLRKGKGDLKVVLDCYSLEEHAGLSDFAQRYSKDGQVSLFNRRTKYCAAKPAMFGG